MGQGSSSDPEIRSRVLEKFQTSHSAWVSPSVWPRSGAQSAPANILHVSEQIGRAETPRLALRVRVLR
eukprot:3667763-Prymnesium_polylepis.1